MSTSFFYIAILSLVCLGKQLFGNFYLQKVLGVRGLFCFCFVVQKNPFCVNLYVLFDLSIDIFSLQCILLVFEFDFINLCRFYPYLSSQNTSKTIKHLFTGTLH